MSSLGVSLTFEWKKIGISGIERDAHRKGLLIDCSGFYPSITKKIKPFVIALGKKIVAKKCVIVTNRLPDIS